jgi:hypothetical protein
VRTHLADIAEPDVGQGAGSLAVDTLKLVLSDDDVAQGCSILQDEHGTVRAYSIRFICLNSLLGGHTSIIITVAGATTIELPVSQIDTAGDHTGRRQRDDVTHARGDVESLGTGNANEAEDDSAGVHFA